jgi:hypothetical protein
VTLQLPQLPQPTTLTYQLQSNATPLTPILGRAQQRIQRLGDKWTFQFACRPLMYNQAIGVTTLLTGGLSQKIRSYFPQPFVNTSGAGSSITFANASGASGTTVAMTGFTPGYTVVIGQFFNVVTNGVANLYQVTGNVTADSSGHASVSFQPMLKAPPNSGDHIEFANPVIEGFVQGSSQQWQLSRVQSVGFSFAISEAI